MRKLPFNSNFASKENLIAIEGETEWWDNLEWDNTIMEHLLRPKFQYKSGISLSQKMLWESTLNTRKVFFNRNSRKLYSNNTNTPSIL
jgi:hypothetical protein